MKSIQPEYDSSTASKINKLLVNSPVGAPMTSAWLSSQGVSPQLVRRYKLSGWLESLGRGAWMRVGTKLTLEGAIYALQQQPLRVYPAARTALELQGRSHYLPVGASPVLQLSVEFGQKLPAWFTHQPFARNLRTFNNSALFTPVYVGLDDWQNSELIIKVSSPERAMLEYCYLLPKSAAFEEARQLMEGLTTLRPQLLQNILQSCKSVKAKRLFLALARVVGHSWYTKLDIEMIDLGKGKRSVMADGCLHPQFKITVPKGWVDS